MMSLFCLLMQMLLDFVSHKHPLFHNLQCYVCIYSAGNIVQAEAGATGYLLLSLFFIIFALLCTILYKYRCHYTTEGQHLAGYFYGAYPALSWVGPT